MYEKGVVFLKNRSANTDPLQFVNNAAKSPNPCADFPEFLCFSSDTTKYDLYCKRKSEMDQKTLNWAFKLAEKNVGQQYKSCSLGWQPKLKKNALNKPWARYFVALNEKKDPMAYAMFRFDMDYGKTVLYCYEMQVEALAQRQGLGGHMMRCLEKIAAFWGMEKLVLTVLKNNPDGMRFYETMGYKIDETSPEKSEEADYEILSKEFD